ncbi:unnamed protein product [Miscanthus lutarioriparius]|uniref:Aspartate transaminase n=1 Tax=Miscanthus lutarioriparius TaxID=422564 RepID=A0A811MQS6_9POAL|nr:unnamed protein product [Miscanthus lutarioriparius]
MPTHLLRSLFLSSPVLVCSMAGPGGQPARRAASPSPALADPLRRRPCRRLAQVAKVHRNLFLDFKECQAPPAPILGVPEAFTADKNDPKLNLGAGAYRTEELQPYVLSVLNKLTFAGMPLWIYATVKLAFTAAHRQGLLDGIWTVVNYPYGNKYDDVKLPDKKPARFTLSIQLLVPEEIVICLGFGNNASVTSHTFLFPLIFRGMYQI